MYLFYLDESGDPAGWQSQDNFVLAAVAVHEGQVRRFSQALDEVQQRFYPGIAVALEFHAQHIHSGKDRFQRLTEAQRSELLEAAYEVLRRAQFPGLVAFISAIHVSAVTSPAQALKDCLQDICQRFNTFLVRQFNAGIPDKGLVIMDRSGRESRIRELMSDFETHGTAYGHLGNIVDVPYFGDSSHTRMLQLADLLAFAGGRYFNHHDDRFLNMVLPRIDRRSAGGPRVGLKHIVSGIPCSCVAIH